MAFVVFGLTGRLMSLLLAVVCSSLCPTSITEALAALQKPFAKMLQGHSELCPGRKEPLAPGPFPVAPLGHIQHEWCLLAGLPPCTAACLVLVPEGNQQHMMVSETNQTPRCQGRSKGSGNLSFTCLQPILGFAAYQLLRCPVPSAVEQRDGNRPWQIDCAHPGEAAQGEKMLGHGSAAAPTGLAVGGGAD